jgi:hypothetical protein
MPLGAASSHYSIGVELLKGDVGLPAYTLLPNSEYYRDYLGSESARDNLRGREGNNPDRLLRSQNDAQFGRKLFCGDSQDVGLEAATI